MGKTILEVENLTKYFATPAGQLHAVDGVSFSIEEGKTLGIVGEWLRQIDDGPLHSQAYRADLRQDSL